MGQSTFSKLLGVRISCYRRQHLLSRGLSIHRAVTLTVSVGVGVGVYCKWKV